MFFKRTKREDSAFGRSVWPRARLVSALKKRFGKIEDLGEDHGFALLGVKDSGIRFVVALALVEGGGDNVSEVGFLARFSGLKVSASQIEAINRNLHLSIATFHSDGDVYLIGGVAAAGDFSDGAFDLVLEAWKRDLLILMHGFGATASLIDASPAARTMAAQEFAVNRPAPGRQADELFAKFASGRSRRAICPDCGGRGRIGFIARTCHSCGGDGLTAGNLTADGAPH